MSSCRLWIYKLLTYWLPESRAFAFKAMLLRWSGAKIGRNVRVYSSVTILGNGNLEIGDDVHIGSKAFLYAASPAKIAIGCHVDVGPGVYILTGSHKIDAAGAHIGGEGVTSSVTICNGSWLGARTTILPGVELQAKTITAAGALITNSCDQQKVLLAGIPAQVKKRY